MEDLESLIGGSAKLAFPETLTPEAVQAFLPHMRLLDTLAETPGSRIFTAQHKSGYDCVVKVYTQPYDRAGAGYLEMQRAKFECEASKRLPNLTPKCLDVSRKQALIFSVWDYAIGHPLNQMKSQFAWSPTLKQHFVDACAHALEQVHAAGVLHLDLKPNHIFVQTEPSLRVQFIDWGLACDRKKGPRPDHLLFATPAFTRPERLAGGNPCPEDDWFALEKSLEDCLGSLDLI